MHRGSGDRHFDEANTQVAKRQQANDCSVIHLLSPAVNDFTSFWDFAALSLHHRHGISKDLSGDRREEFFMLQSAPSFADPHSFDHLPLFSLITPHTNCVKGIQLQTCRLRPPVLLSHSMFITTQKVKHESCAAFSKELRIDLMAIVTSCVHQCVTPCNSWHAVRC